jgi:Transport and Golgi organisation 2
MGMCTAVLSIEAGGQVLLAGVRDELADRAWQPPGWHWPDYPGLIGGQDLLAGGTWLAVAPAARRVACVLNGRGRQAPAGSRRSRGTLPLLAAAGRELERAGLADVDPFHLLTAEPGSAVLRSWDGERLTERELTTGLHIVVNSGLGSELLSGHAGSGQPRRQPGRESAENDHELARVAHFLPRFRAAIRPVPRPGSPVAQAWGAWLPLLNGDGIPADDPRALIVWRDLGAGRIWGTTSISLVALSPAGLRYDFTGAPGDPAAWCPVQLTP